MCILLSPWLSPRHLAYTNLSKSGTLLQAPTLVHKLHTSQVFAYKVRLGVYPPLTLALCKTPCLHESLQVWNTLVASNTYAYAPHTPSLCMQGRTWCVSSSHLVSSSNTILEAPQGPCHITLVCIHCKACPFAKKASASLLASAPSASASWAASTTT